MNYPKSRQSNIVVQELENEVLIFDLEINRAYCLNQTSALVYEFANGTRTVSEISELLSKHLKLLVTEDLVWLALEQLKKDNLLENNDTLEINFGGLSRREVIKKVGFASMIALPLISSVIAPQSIDAQSVCGDIGGACNFPNNRFVQGSCCSGLRCGNFNTCQTCIPSGVAFDICGTGCGICNNLRVFPRKNLCCNSGTATNDEFSCYCP